MGVAGGLSLWVEHHKGGGVVQFSSPALGDALTFTYVFRSRRDGLGRVQIVQFSEAVGVDHVEHVIAGGLHRVVTFAGAGGASVGGRPAGEETAQTAAAAAPTLPICGFRDGYQSANPDSVLSRYHHGPICKQNPIGIRRAMSPPAPSAGVRRS